jgi:DNA-binding transcriptional ArsR family regulator
MEAVLWQVLAGTRGGPNRARVLRALDRRPRNANQLAEDLELSYKTVRHHLDVLEDNGVIDSGDSDYGRIYLPSDRVRRHWDTAEEIMNQLDDEQLTERTTGDGGEPERERDPDASTEGST